MHFLPYFRPNLETISLVKVYTLFFTQNGQNIYSVAEQNGQNLFPSSDTKWPKPNQNGHNINPSSDQNGFEKPYPYERTHPGQETPTSAYY